MNTALNGMPQLEALCSIKNRYGNAAGTEKIKLLQQLADCPLSNTSFIKKYHDCLLFLISQPDNHTVYVLAGECLEKIKPTVDRIFNSTALAKQRALNSTGIYGTEIICAFSFDIALWLKETCGDQVALHSSAAGAEQVSKVMELFLPGMEYQSVTQSGYSLVQRIKKLTGNKNKADHLRWLLESMKNIQPASLRNYLYDQLQVFNHWKLSHPFFSNTGLRALPMPLYYQKENAFVIKNYKSFIKKKIAQPCTISDAERSVLLDVARTSLALLHRETDPVSFCDSKTIQYFNMGYGISIALYTMIPEKRCTIESYIGYMAFKNSVPLAYGGGWLFGQRCKIGINIYPAFRGGDSALLFCSILRLYHQYFGAKRFVVKPYQFGLQNPEGLRSGAFWFYYKLGFKPLDDGLCKISANEFLKKQQHKNYRTPLTVLQQFTGSPVELVLDKKAFPVYDASIISTAITKNINMDFLGDRAKALHYYTQQLRKISINNFTARQKKLLIQQAAWLAILFKGDEKAAEWTVREKQDMLSLLLSKYDTEELDYIKQMQAHKKLWQVLDRFAAD